MGRVFLMAFATGLFGLIIGIPLVRATNLFRDLTGGGQSVVVVLFFLTGVVTGAIAGATDAIVHAIKYKKTKEMRGNENG